MNYEQLKNRDFKDDNVNPEALQEHLRSHDKEMRRLQPKMALSKAAYITRWWEWVEGNKDGADAPYRLGRIDRIQVNRIKPAIASYLNSLYPRRMRVVFGPDATGGGDPKITEKVVNKWFRSNNVRDRVLLCSRQALLYPGAGCKVGYDPGAGSALDRVWIRSFPWWELVLDRDVHDWDDARFVGHVYYRPKHEVEEEYGVDNLIGSSRADFLSSSSLGGQETGKSKGYGDEGSGDEDHFVRVYEVCNMVDEVEDPDDPSIRYQGRLEIYILDQGTVSRKPVFMGPLPYSNPDGTPMPHIVPLIFEHEPEYPFRGLSYAEQLLPQQMELNTYRSYMSQASRKDSRQYVTKKGVLDSETKTMLMDGEEGLVVEVDEAYQGSLRDVIAPIEHGNISNNIRENMSLAEQDLERNMAMSPAALGVVTKATAEEVRAVEAHTESEYGRHAESRDRWLERTVRVALRALIAAMQDRGDSEGAYEHTEEEALSAGGGDLPEGEVQVADEDSAKSEADRIEDELRFDDAGKQDEEGGDEEGGEDEEDEVATKVQADDVSEGAAEADVRGAVWPMTESRLSPETVIELIDEQGEFITVTVEQLDAEFDIGFTETGRSPMGDQEMKQNLVNLNPVYFQLLEQVVSKGPMAIAAKAYLEAIHDRFELPKSLDPALILSEMEQESEEKGGQPEQPPAAPEQAGAPPMPPGGPAPGGAPPTPPAPGGAPAGPPGGGQIEQIVQNAMQLPPDQALEVFAQLFASDPEALKVIEEAKMLPPEQQAQAIQMIGQQILGQ